MLRTQLFFSIALIGVLMGCAKPPVTDMPQTAVANELRRAAMDAKAAQWQLAAIQQAKTGTGLLKEGGVLTTPAGLESPVSITWVGPYQDLVKAVANQTGYGYEINGQAPVNPIIVRVQAEQIPAIVVLRDASWQVRNRASLEISESQKMLHIRFHHDE
ncbi:MAG: DotD/TraH family lipoprotein [Candidatus Competibacter denitrificans]